VFNGLVVGDVPEVVRVGVGGFGAGDGAIVGVFVGLGVFVGRLLSKHSCRQVVKLNLHNPLESWRQSQVTGSQ
jgi:hypothetical protein